MEKEKFVPLPAISFDKLCVNRFILPSQELTTIEYFQPPADEVRWDRSRFIFPPFRCFSTILANASITISIYRALFKDISYIPYLF